jgi:transposase
MSNFRPIDRGTAFLLPPSVDEWLPARHLARFVVEVVDQLDLSVMVKSYRGAGSASYHPAMLLALLIYGYATGVFSSRKIERATHDSIAFRFIAANLHPDHDTLATFRRRFLKEIEQLFTEVLLLAKEMKLLNVGTVALDGTKLHANANRHSALSYGHAQKIETQLREEVRELLVAAERADAEALPDELSIPEEIERREARLNAIGEAKAKIEARAKERFEREQADYAAKQAAREEKSKRTGKPPRGKPPAPPSAEPRPSDQVNLTDEDSRIMRVAGGGFEQCYNAQALVATGSLLVVGRHVTQAANDKEQVQPLLEQVRQLPERLGSIERLLTDAGYTSTANIEACEAAGLEPFMAVSREAHHLSWRDRFAEPPPLAAEATPLEKMAHRLKTQAGRTLYALRKQTPEPVFGIIKSAMGFRQFSLRGLDKVRGEWNLVTMTWNIRRMFALQVA